ncbi:C-type lectin domain family 10 member A-like [Etheostoma cragini]|uniref:C-type lectin domain family 10 member A-like n=1 Tax=Etheostoma cragini TaxID=417921 RepID=UPI00155EECAB|nr:C-type lectin domain family 10 member A-like [Etheostoma cragini]
MTTTEYRDIEDDSSSFWNKEPAPVSLSAVSRFRRWLFPALTATFILVLIIVLGASNTQTSNRLWSLEKTVSNVNESLSSVQQLAKDAAKDVNRLKFSVENNKDQLISVGEALKQLSVVDSLSQTVASLKCSLERIINNSSAVEGCCPLDWLPFGSSCYLFSKTSASWPRARDWCNGHEAHLVIPITDEDWNFVIRQAGGVFHWVGLTDEKGEWEWVNQTPYVMNRRRWMPGQPDSWTGHGFGPGDEDCAHIHTDGRLNDLHCSTRLRYICQKHRLRS